MDRNIELALQHLENIKADPSSNLNGARVSLAIEVLHRIPQRKPLTDEFLRKLHHIDQFRLFCDYDDFEQISRAIEAAHGIKE